MKKIVFPILISILFYPVYVLAGTGTGIWEAGGVEIADPAGDQLRPIAVTDGADGAILVWEDANTPGIYALKVDSKGVIAPGWNASGEVISSSFVVSLTAELQAISDGTGGAIIVWSDNRDGSLDVYAQRIDSAGERQWDIAGDFEGIPVSTGPWAQDMPSIAMDGSGGVVIAYEDARTLTNRIVAQRLDSSGNKVWTSTGVIVCQSSEMQYWPKIINDGSNNFIITWQDSRNSKDDIYCQKLNATGVKQWPVAGQPVCTESSRDQIKPEIVSDDEGGAIIAWWDDREVALNNLSIYAQRLDGNGDDVWTPDGIKISSDCLAINDTSMSIAKDADDASGFFIAWLDELNGPSPPELYAQYIDDSGAKLWGDSGVIVSTDNASTRSYPGIISDNEGGAIVTWLMDYDVFSQKIHDAQKLWQVKGVSATFSGGADAPSMISDSYIGALVVYQREVTGEGIFVQKVTDADTTAPNTVTDLVAASGTRPDEVQLTWTAPGDDGVDGTASNYILKYATYNSFGWNSVGVNVYVQSWDPAILRGQEDEDLLLVGGTTYYFKLRADDGIPNYSEESNITTACAQVDDEAPSAITASISASPGNLEGRIDLSWSAPYENEVAKTGTAQYYEIRYTTILSSANSWNNLVIYSTKQVSGGYGTSESLTLTGLTGGVTYYMRIKSYDEVPLTSLISYGATTYAQLDITPPSSITNLSALTGGHEGEIFLSWTAPGDDGMVKGITGGKYRIKWSTNSTYSWSSSDYEVEISTTTNPHVAESYLAEDLVGGVTYYFRVWTADELDNWSGVSNNANAIAQVDIDPPTAISGLTALTGDWEGQVRLNWVAPGDDFMVGTAEMYSIRYSTISGFDWTNDWATAGEWLEPATMLAGSPQVVIVTGLANSTTMYFRIRTGDETALSKPPGEMGDRRNWSTLSVGATAWVLPDTDNPSTVSDLAAAVGPYEGTIQLSWTSAYDNQTPGFGSIAQYELRYSSGPNFFWGSSTHTYTSYTGTAPVSSALTENITISGLVSGATYTFFIKSFDEVPLASSVSPSATSYAQVHILPARITDLIESGTEEPEQMRLIWTEPGDDGTVGVIDRYLVKCTTTNLTETGTSWWNHAKVKDITLVPGINTVIPSPSAPGAVRTYVLTGLINETTHYIGMVGVDELGNESTDMANLVKVAFRTLDGTLPDSIEDFDAVSGAFEGSIDLAWTVTGDDGSINNISNGAYRIHYSTIYSVMNSTGVDTYSVQWSTDAIAGAAEAMTISGLMRDTSYWFSLWVRDEIGVNWSTWSVVSGALALPDIIAPSMVTDLTAQSPGPSMAQLYWTAPGDNGGVDDFGLDATAVSPKFVIKYTDAATDATTSWCAAAQDALTDGGITIQSVTTLYTPTTAGRTHGVILSGLTDFVTYWFSVQTIDEAGNASPYSQTFFCIPPDSVGPGITSYTQLGEINGAGNYVLITATATDNYAGIKRMELYYRVHGATETKMDILYEELVSCSTGPVVSTGTIDGNYVTAADVDFIIKIIDKSNNEGFSTGESRAPWEAGFGTLPAVAWHLIQVSTSAAGNLGAAGGTVTFTDGNPNDGTTRVVLPINALDTGVQVAIAELDPDDFVVTAAERHPYIVSTATKPIAIFDFTLDSTGVYFNSPATIFMLYINNAPEDDYVDGTGDTVDEDDLRMFWHDGFTWRYVGGTVHPHTYAAAASRNTVEASVMHFSKYALFPVDSASIAAAILDNTRPKERIITPNSDGQNDYAEFELGTISEYTVNIFNVNGRNVRSISSSETGGGNVVWWGEDDNGATVQSGLYIYQVRASSTVVSGVIAIAK